MILFMSYTVKVKEFPTGAINVKASSICMAWSTPLVNEQGAVFNVRKVVRPLDR